VNKNRWQLHRAGLFNYWYYDDEEFHFHDGKLLLRGSNGSGKSVTMQSLITILLDGKKSPDRLDPFGSKARRMEDYLLGEKDVVDLDERTGYLYLEYKREGTEQYLTTGIGLRAKRHTNIDFWGFVIHDNRRIGKDLFLYKTEYSVEKGKEQKIPLTRKELENRLADGGKLVRGQKEYMDLVNRYLFGFKSSEEYEELIKLLIQLRSPKLSKDFKPTVIYEILNDSLPNLSDEELRPLSDTIESMDQIKQQLEQLEREQYALKNLTKNYDMYNRVILLEKAEGLLKTEKRLKELTKEQENFKNQLSDKEKELTNLEEKFQQLNREETVLKDEEKRLSDHDVTKAEREKQEIENAIADIKKKIYEKETTFNQKKKKEFELRASKEEEERKQLEIEKEIDHLLDELHFYAEEAQFSNHEMAADEFERKYQSEYLFDLWKKETRDYQDKLESILKTLREETKAKERFQELDKELGEVKKEFDLKQKEIKDWEALYEEEKDRLLDRIHQWHKNNQELHLNEQDIQMLSRYVMQLYQPYRYEEIKQIITDDYDVYRQKINSKLLENQHKLNNKQQEIDQKTLELKEWKDKKDPEPKRHQDTIEARNELEQKGIPYLPLYAAVEFYEDISPEQRERIEAAITQTGLLDALIINKKHHKQVSTHDRIITPNPKLFAHTLADVLYPTPVEGIAITKEDIDNVLRSILIEESEEALTTIKDDGSYRIGVLNGHAPRSEKAIFIGRESRKKYRLQEIARMEAELHQLNEEKLILENEKERLEQHLLRLNNEYKAFPTDESVNESFQQLNQLNNHVQLLEQEVNQKNEKVKTAIEKLQNIRNQLRQLTDGMALDQSEAAYEQAKTSMQNYQNHLQELVSIYKDFTHNRNRRNQLQDTLDELIEDIDIISGEINILHSEQKKWLMKLDNVLKRMEQLGAEEIRRRIEQVVQKLNQIPEEKEKTIRKSEEVKHVISNLINHIENNHQQVVFTQALYQQWIEVFVEDDKLQLLDKKNDEELQNEAYVLKRAKQVRYQYQSLIDQSKLNRESAYNRLNTSFIQQQPILIEYRLTQESLFEDVHFSFDTDDEHQQMLMEQIHQKARRIQLLMEYNGKRVTPYYVLEQIDKDIELQKQLLDEKDRELYEEIILNSVGKIIRGRIQRAEKWVEKINELMLERDTSSGLTLSIRWRPRTAEVEDELDTNELVDLLRRDPSILKDEDLERVTRHFKSKISRAKELLEDKNFGETLHQLIKELLDYRKWFSFTLYFKKGTEKRKELTNNAFDKLSGGEKAMAMYIPLFSAAYSRYLEAEKDAPYIITLDEAFAGVDENNIRDMFDLVEKLGFNYIFNSQSLWGDYDTVSSLSICELVRPKNAAYVTVIRYHWDGKARHLVDKFNDIEQEQDENLKETSYIK